MKDSLKLAARAIRLLQKYWRDHQSYQGFELDKMKDLPKVIERARTMLTNNNKNKESHLTPLKIEEWDIDDMFNNIHIDTVKDHVTHLIERVKRIITAHPRDIYLHIGTDPADDYISNYSTPTGTHKSHTNGHYRL